MDLVSLACTPADPGSPLPLYYQVEHDLRRLIEAGKVPPGEALPPEEALRQAYGVSRQTMRTALGHLADEDLIWRRAGQGTFVKARPDPAAFYLDRSFTRQMKDMGRRAHARVLEQSTHVPAPLRRKLGDNCLYLVRLRFGDDEPIGLQRAIILTDRCQGLHEHDFAVESLYEVLATQYRLRIAEIRHTIGATVADAEQAELLRVAQGDPLVLVNTTALLEDGQVIEYTTSYYRADRYEYSTTHTLR